MSGLTSEPGRPLLPYKSFVIELPRNAQVTAVGAIDVRYRTLMIYGKIAPAAHPVPLMPDFQRFLDMESPPEEDPAVYESDAYYPGSLA